MKFITETESAMRKFRLRMLCGAAVLLAVTGCAVADMEVLAPCDITADELDDRITAVTDRNGVFAQAESLVQEQVITDEDGKESLVVVKYRKPDKISITVYEDNRPFSKLVINGDRGWVTDFSRRTTSGIGEDAVANQKFFNEIMAPDADYSAIFSDLKVEECAIGDEHYYKLTCFSPELPRPIEIYADRGDFTVRRLRGRTATEPRVDYDVRILRYEEHDSVIVPMEMETVMNGVRQRTVIIKYLLNVPVDEQEFLPASGIGSTAD